MNLNNLKNFIVGILGGLLGSFLFLLIIFTYPGNRLQAYILSHLDDRSNDSTENHITPTVLPSLAPDFWEHISSEASLSSVAVQVFKDNRIIKSGSGITLSSDGLVVIPADLTHLGGIYQVLYEDKIAKGVVVSFDIKRNLAIIKITNPGPGLNVSDLNTDINYQSGQDVLIAGKLSDLSRPTTISQKGIISYVNGSRIIIDTFTNPALIGAKVLNSRGDLAGMLYIRSGKSFIVSSKDIDTFFREYLK